MPVAPSAPQCVSGVNFIFFFVQFGNIFGADSGSLWVP